MPKKITYGAPSAQNAQLQRFARKRFVGSLDREFSVSLRTVFR